MATLSLPKNYQDGDPLFESDLDDIRTGIEDFLNSTKINDDNIQSAGISGTKLKGSIAGDALDLSGGVLNVLPDDSTIEVSGDAIQVKDDGITDAKIKFSMPIGTILPFYDYNGTVSVPRGWMSCNGDVVNQSNYDALHGSGAYTADGISSSAVDGKNLPDLDNKYPVGGTTQDGTSAISSEGNANHNVSTSNHTHLAPLHSHLVYDFTSTSSSSNLHDANGNNLAIGDDDVTLSTGGIGIGVAFNGDSALGTDYYTDEDGQEATSAAGSESLNIKPESIAVSYIIKVV